MLASALDTPCDDWRPTDCADCGPTDRGDVAVCVAVKPVACPAAGRGDVLLPLDALRQMNGDADGCSCALPLPLPLALPPTLPPPGAVRWLACAPENTSRCWLVVTTAEVRTPPRVWRRWSSRCDWLRACAWLPRFGADVVAGAVPDERTLAASLVKGNTLRTRGVVRDLAELAEWYDDTLRMLRWLCW
mmetsp:Transcript_83060/g.169297  ORF Transcript_83060/g.169297 Transcript_83060/m.169297 type:complete len:189 (+) Transcript_83060:1545-2111(+)